MRCPNCDEWTSSWLVVAGGAITTACRTCGWGEVTEADGTRRPADPEDLAATRLLSRTYVGGVADLRPCRTCGVVCLPHPYRDSPTCSWCYYLRQTGQEVS